MEFLKNNKIKYIREELRYPAFETERYYCCKEVNNLNVFSSIEANKLYFNYIEITGSRYANIAVQAVNNVVDSNTPAINFRIGIYTRGFRLPEKLIASEQIVLDAVDRNGLLETANLNLELVGGIYALAYVASESNFMLLLQKIILLVDKYLWSFARYFKSPKRTNGIKIQLPLRCFTN
ncbi:MAG: hypothetical protein HC836_47130 [Richelia sp. RM2_1_2]|nr:hypothetical protein [Richelia sp. RM2_1_2]